MENSMQSIYFGRWKFGELKFLSRRSTFNCNLLLNLQINVSLPWDQTTPLGYFGEMCFSIMNLEAFWIVGGQILLLFIFVCRNNFIFAEMFVSFLNEFDQLENMQEKHIAIQNLIAFHTDVKRWYKTLCSILTQSSRTYFCFLPFTDFLMKHAEHSAIALPACSSGL